MTVQLLLLILQAIRREFLSYLEDDEHDEEKAKLLVLQNTGQYQTAEEREIAAKPPYASDYWKPFNAFRAAQRIFSDEVALIDEACRDKKNKKTFGNRTTAIRIWFDGLSKSKLEEAEKAATKWNTKGALDKDRMHM
jgi:hypothetical protein